jgi:hypothetical protein
MEISDVDPEELRRYLEGIEWPADKQTVMTTAKSNGAPEHIQGQMSHSLAVRTFSGPEEVSDHMRS